MHRRCLRLLRLRLCRRVPLLWLWLLLLLSLLLALLLLQQRRSIARASRLALRCLQLCLHRSHRGLSGGDVVARGGTTVVTTPATDTPHASTAAAVDSRRLYI
jgi:hypothetical protein